MNQQEIEKLAGRLFSTLFESSLSEAEIVSALAIAITMRLAHDSETMDEVISKLEKLAPIFIAYAKTNLAAFEAAQQAKHGIGI